MPTVREYEHVPSPEVLGAAVQHCARCGKRLAPHDHFPVRDTDGAWTCVVCPASIAPRAFVAALRDPTTGLSRAVTIEVYLRSLLVRLGPPQPTGEDGAHHAAADFTEQRPAIVAAFPEVVTEIANAAKVGVDTGFAAGSKVAERIVLERDAWKAYAQALQAVRVAANSGDGHVDFEAKRDLSSAIGGLRKLGIEATS